MIFAVLFFVCGVTEIMGRPSIGLQNTNDDTLVRIPPWPITNNMFLLPRILKVDDIINITVVIADTPIFDLKLISENSTSNTTDVVCKLVVNENKVILYKGDEEKILHEDDLIHFIREESESTFNVWFKRRITPHSQDDNVLEVHSKISSKPFLSKQLDNLRFLQFTGENIKVSKLEFEFV